jgi:C4-dicarboxylate transporter DctM subunit
MSNFSLGLVSFAAMLAMLAVRVPIGVAMLAAGAGGFVIVSGLAPFLSYVKATPFDAMGNYSFSVIPLFLLMGNFASRSGLSAGLFRAANAFVGHWRGGMAMAAVSACAAFGTICGSSLATAATMGQVSLPEMRRYGYSGALATGSLAAGGTLGILVPPSVPLVVYAILTEQNIAKLFLAAFIPAAMALTGFCIAIRAYVALHPEAGPPTERVPWGERLRRVGEIWPVIGIFVVVFAGMNGDVFVGRSLFTPTEGAAVGAFCTGLVAVTVGRMPLREVVPVLKDTAGQTGMIFLILLGAEIYNAFLARTGMPQEAAQLVAGLGVPPVVVVVVIIAVYIVLGCLMDSLSMILLTVPIFFPIVMALNFGLTPEHQAIWFGILALIVVELGLIHPPVGLNVYIIHSIAKDVSMLETFKGVVPFLIAEFVRVGLIIAFPSITLLAVRGLG